MRSLRHTAIPETPENVNEDQLVYELGKMNYIAEGSEGIYKEAFLREYRRYYEGKKQFG